ncbi:MAG: glutamine synthetase, partial [Lachnospiraceae bacterium]|nr:glutamine synthetase [Lachnospiraceae bacterium]
RLICDVYRPDGTPFAGDPRYVLKRAIREAEEMGFIFRVGAECEFFLFHLDDNGMPTTLTHEKAGYFDVGPVDFGENARRDMVLTLEDMGFVVEASHHDVAPAQHEISFRYDEALATADNIMTFRLAVRTIAKRHGLHATFMPKPKYGVNGSGMHINMSLLKDGKNIFADGKDARGLSRDAYAFLGGIMEHMRGMTAVTNPIVNSYKRLVPGFEAPAYIAWSATNRSPLIRIPAARGEAVRMELRSPDPTANPYLALAAILRAGLDGIRRQVVPPESVDCNIFRMSEQERRERKIVELPGTLAEAVSCMEKDAFMRETLGEHVFGKYIELKKEEWNRYRSQITDWEINEYLNQF